MAVAAAAVRALAASVGAFTMDRPAPVEASAAVAAGEKKEVTRAARRRLLCVSLTSAVFAAAVACSRLTRGWLACSDLVGVCAA